jgi:hypothetical protein
MNFLSSSILIGAGATVVVDLWSLLRRRLFGAGLRAPEHLLLFEKLLNLVHARAPLAKICFNTNPADSAAAVQRWA